ncbi:GNAT family N-acetyltransferase [Phormidesmis sp. 146-33]
MFVASAYRMVDREPFQVRIGQQLLNTLYNWATRSITDIYLGTVAAFKAAHRFYQKNGFRSVGRADLPLSFPVMSGDTHFYRRMLKQS